MKKPDAHVQILVRRLVGALVGTQHSVAEQVGVTDNAVTAWTHGRSAPTRGNMVQLAEVAERKARELVDLAAELREAAGEAPEAPRRRGDKG